MAEIFLQDADFTLWHGDAIESLQKMESDSVDCIVTSPPYFGLRDYGTGIWEGGDSECEHSVGGQVQDSKAPGAITTGQRPGVDASTCRKCGAHRIDKQIGLEQTPEAYIEKMVEVFREVRRVLAPHGTTWINIGASYNSNPAGKNPGGFQGEQMRSNDEYDEAQTRHVAGERAPGLGKSKTTSFKPKDLIPIPWMLGMALQADGWWLRMDVIWCLSGGTRLYAKTAKGVGVATIHELVRLDPSTVQLWNGERWTRVVSWTRSAVRGEPLEIELASGQKIGCTVGHVWPTHRGNVRTDELRIGDVIHRTTLPEPESPDMPALLPDEEIGYLVGRYLGDGSMSEDTVQISCHAKEVEMLVNRLKTTAKALHCTAVAHTTGGHKTTVNLQGPIMQPLIRMYVYGDSAKTKRLRARAWRRSNAFLMSLLRGYLDADGHYDSKNERWRISFTRNDRLAADLRTICARLDLPLRVATATATGFGKKWPIYRADIRLLRSQHQNARQDTCVVAIGKSRARAFWDVEVEDDPHLFSLASGVLTHNSKPNPLPESITDRPTKSHEYVLMLSKNANYYFDQWSVRENAKWERWGDQTVVKPQPGAASWISNRSKADLLAAHAPRGASGTASSGSTLRPELCATLDTDDGTTDTWGWCDLGELEIAIDSPMTDETQRLQILKPVSLDVGIEASEGPLVVNLDGAGLAAADTAMPITLASKLTLLSPVWASVVDASPTPCGAILATSPRTEPSTTTLLRAKVVGLHMTHIAGKWLAAEVTLQSEEFSATLLIWGTSGTAHQRNTTAHSASRNIRSVWTINTQAYADAHFAVFPEELARRCIAAGCPEQVCRECGKPRERIVEAIKTFESGSGRSGRMPTGKQDLSAEETNSTPDIRLGPVIHTETLGFTDCGHSDYRSGVALDPFMGSGTTALVARKLGRHSVGIELNGDYCQLIAGRLQQLSLFA